MNTAKWFVFLSVVCVVSMASGCGPFLGGGKEPTALPAENVLRDAATSALGPHNERWYRYDVWDDAGERLEFTSDWEYSDGNTFHQVGFVLYDESQYQEYGRGDNPQALGLAGATGLGDDFGPPVSRKVWKGVLPGGSYFIRLYNDTGSDMVYTIRASKH